MTRIERIVRLIYNGSIRKSRYKCTVTAVHTFTANDAKVRFGEFLDLAQRSPVRVTRRERVVGVMVSAQDYEAMRAFYADRLLRGMSDAASEAAAAGLTAPELDRLLTDAD